MIAVQYLRQRPRGLPWLVACFCLMLVTSPIRAEPPIDVPVAPGAPPTPSVPSTPTPPADPLLIGSFALAPDAVVDGDTVRVIGRKKSVRVLGVDTEETFKREHHRKAAGVDFAAYAKEMRGSHPRPVKYGTPAGEAARDFVSSLMKGVTQVRLERDIANGRDVDGFGRTLAFVMVERPEGRVNLSEALIRAGHSPYFVKYGRSARFHKLFTRAEKEAQTAKRGIWGDVGPAHYPDYDERLPWWHARDKQRQTWLSIADQPSHITLGTDKAAKQLVDLVGKPVTVFGSVERLSESKSSDRKILYMSHRRKESLPLVVFDKAVSDQLDMPTLTSMFVKVTGTISLYRTRPQIIISDPAQVNAR